jgi:hypothetical protein
MLKPYLYSMREIIFRSLKKNKIYFFKPGLALTYFIVITPVAFIRRYCLKRTLLGRNKYNMGGWQSINQCSKNRALYAPEVIKFSRSNKKNWIIIVYYIFLKLFYFAEFSREKKLNSNLYILF